MTDILLKRPLNHKSSIHRQVRYKGPPSCFSVIMTFMIGCLLPWNIIIAKKDKEFASGG